MSKFWKAENGKHLEKRVNVKVLESILSFDDFHTDNLKDISGKYGDIISKNLMDKVNYFVKTTMLNNGMSQKYK